MVNIALFGAGRIGVVHAANIIANPRARLAYIYDTNAAAAEAIAGKYGGQSARCVQSVLADKAVDAVLIASPTNTHGFAHGCCSRWQGNILREAHRSRP